MWKIEKYTEKNGKTRKKQAKLCKMIDGISQWIYNGKDWSVLEKCFLRSGVQAAEMIFQTRS